MGKYFFIESEAVYKNFSIRIIDPRHKELINISMVIRKKYVLSSINDASLAI
jgi:hypothetical protein